MEVDTRRCPGCGLEMPRADSACRSYYHTIPECWSVYCEVLAAEYQNAVLFARIHQLTVDAYAAQHAGGPHPDKSVGVHLIGLYLALERDLAPIEVPAQLQRMASTMPAWPHFDPPAAPGSLTVFHVAMAESPIDHARRSREWAEQVWASWGPCHRQVAGLVTRVFEEAERRPTRTG